MLLKMEQNWIKIYGSEDQFKVELAKAVLENANINAVIKNMQDSFYKFGEIELYVNQEDVFEANQILKDII